MTFNSAWAHLLIDMDGVLWRGSTPLAGLSAFFAALHATERRFMLVTNNSRLTPEQYVAKLARMGITVTANEVVTSAVGTAEYLRQHAPAGSKMHAFGEQGVRQALQDAGFELVERGADYVVVGLDNHMNMKTLTQATYNLNEGARLVGTNGDVTFPTEEGSAPGNGAILAALAAASGQTPLIVGKPEPTLYNIAMQRLGASAATTVAIGDRLSTDIEGAARAGIASILLMTGVTTPEKLANSAVRPTLVYRGLPELTAAITGAGE